MTETKPLLAFAAVIEHGTMHAAARALGMTPSAVSQHISRLEALHGVKLLKRSTRRTAPTEAGAALAAHCVKLRQALLDAQAALDNIKTEAAGEVRLARPSPLTLAPDFQTALLRVAAEFPKISMRLFVTDELADLQRHNIDIALRGGDTALDAPDLVARHLADWQWQIYAAPSYIAQTGQPESPADLRWWRWLSGSDETIVRHVLRRGAERFELETDNVWPCGDLMSARQLTAAGLGVSVQLDGEMRGWVREGRLQVLLPDWTLPKLALYAVTPHRVQSAKVAAVLGCLTEAFQAGK